MPKTKYNWQDLKRDFFTSDFNEVKSFLGDRKVAYNSRTRVNTKGWLEEKEAYQNEVNERALANFKDQKSTILAEGLKIVTELMVKELKKYQSIPTVDLDPKKLYTIWKMLRVESGLYTEVPYREARQWKTPAEIEMESEKAFEDLMYDYGEMTKNNSVKN